MGWEKDMVRFFTFGQFHNKSTTGSTRIRAQQLIKYWDEAELYKYGEKPDTLIFQKVYCTPDYKFPKHYDGGLKILDICDPDWLEGHLIKETVDAMDAIVSPTQPIIDFLKQLSDIPMRVIKDRFDLEEFPPPKYHRGKLETVVWFGYKHNAELLKGAVHSLRNRKLKLIVIAEEDPHIGRWAEGFEDYYTFYKYRQDNLYSQLQEADVCVLPKGSRPRDLFKSENKTVIAQLCGLPVATDADELDALKTPESRNEAVQKVYTKLQQGYDVKKSVEEYKELIDEIKP